MKIGIITQPLHNNYGGLLQNYALQKVLRDNGHEPVTLDWNMPTPPLWFKCAYAIKVFFMRNFFGHKEYEYDRYQPSDAEKQVIEQHTRRFIEENISRTSKVATSEGFAANANEEHVEAYVVGSDQVWRPGYAGGLIADMFLSFASESILPKVAYAASFGTDKWEFSSSQTDTCSRLAKQFSCITVREESGKTLCKDFLGVDATHVLDPTMLLDKDVYETLVTSDNTPKSKGNLFYYVLDPSQEKATMIKQVAENLGLKPFTILPTYQAENRTKKNIKNEIEKCIFPSVTSWLRAFMDAEMVICDSFHGCVFSIIFNKPFWVIGNKHRGNTRFDSLLKTFGLQSRFVTDITDIDESRQIDWDKVNTIRKEKGLVSKNLLLKTLSQHAES